MPQFSFVYVYMIATDAPAVAQQLLEIAQTTRNRCQKHHWDDQDRSKFRKHENVCLRNQAKRLKKRSKKKNIVFFFIDTGCL